MLFETQAKADNFIKFNKDEILEDHGRAPVRSYYCSFCNGYHVTSNPSTEFGEKLNVEDEQALNEVLERFYHRKIRKSAQSDLCNKKDKTIASALKVPIWNKLQKALSILKVGKLSEFKTLINECTQEIKESRSIWPNGYLNKLTELEKHVTAAHMLLSDIEYLLNKDDKTQAEYISNLETEKQELIKNALHNYNIINSINALLADCGVLITNKKFDEAEEVLKRVNVLFDEISTKAINSMYPEVAANYSKLKEKVEHATIIPYDYKETLLSLIERIDSIKKAFAAEDYNQCQNLIDAGYVILDDLEIEDDSTKLIREQLDLLAKQL